MVLHGCVPWGPHAALHGLFHIWLTLSKPIKSITDAIVSVSNTDHEGCIKIFIITLFFGWLSRRKMIKSRVIYIYRHMFGAILSSYPKDRHQDTDLYILILEHC